MSFVLIRIIMSLFPFIKEAFFGTDQEKNRSTIFLMTLASLVFMVGVFFLQADVIKTLYTKNKELIEKSTKHELETAKMTLDCEALIKDKDNEHSNLRAIIGLQDGMIRSCKSYSRMQMTELYKGAVEKNKAKADDTVNVSEEEVIDKIEPIEELDLEFTK